VWDAFLEKFPDSEVDSKVPCDHVYEDVLRLHAKAVDASITAPIICSTSSVHVKEKNKHDLVEPVVYKGGVMSAAQRNQLYKSHQIPGIGRKVILSVEAIAARKVLSVCMYACMRVCMYACMHVCMYVCIIHVVCHLWFY
jgi:hypothetical protein